MCPFVQLKVELLRTVHLRLPAVTDFRQLSAIIVVRLRAPVAKSSGAVHGAWLRGIAAKTARTAIGTRSIISSASKRHAHKVSLFFRGDERVFTAGADGCVRIWNSETGECLHLGFDLNFSQDGTRALTEANERVQYFTFASTSGQVPKLTNLALPVIKYALVYNKCGSEREEIQ